MAMVKATPHAREAGTHAEPIRTLLHASRSARCLPTNAVEAQERSKGVVAVTTHPELSEAAALIRWVREPEQTVIMLQGAQIKSSGCVHVM